MKPELEEKLLTKYPELFVQHEWSMQTTCICWGIECWDGWYNLLDGLCGNIMDYCKSRGITPPQFTQVKQKYGTLRVYINLADETIYDMVDKAENESANICEKCGSNDGVKFTEGWLTALCNNCKKNINK